MLHGNHRDALAADDSCRASSTSCSVNALQRSMELAGHTAQAPGSSAQSLIPQMQSSKVSNPNSRELQGFGQASPLPQVKKAAVVAEDVLDSAAGDAAIAMDDMNRSLIDTAKDLGVQIPVVVAAPDDTIEMMQKKIQDEAEDIAAKARAQAWNQSAEGRVAVFAKLGSMNKTLQGGMERVETAVSKAESAINSLESELNSTGRAELSMRSFAQGIVARGAVPTMISVASIQWHL